MLSVVLASPLALLMPGTRRAARPVGALCRALAALLAGVPELVYVLVFVRSSGPLAGACALAVHGVGQLAKLWSEQLEAVDGRPVEALRLTGAGRGCGAGLGVLPQARAGLLSLLLYQLKCDIRSATVLGIVGAVGLGQAIELSLRLFDHAKLGTLVAAVLVLVLVVDALSRRLRGQWGPKVRACVG